MEGGGVLERRQDGGGGYVQEQGGSLSVQEQDDEFQPKISFHQNKPVKDSPKGKRAAGVYVLLSISVHCCVLCEHFGSSQSSPGVVVFRPK